MNRKWIFIRGLARHSGHWGPFLTQFKKYFPKDEVELLDLRGNGTLSHSPSCLSILENVRDLRSRSQFVKTDQPVYLMTISLGSMIGAEWASRYPQEIAGLVTINTSDRRTSYFWERLRPNNYKVIFQLLTKGKNNPALEKDILKLTTNELSQNEEWAQHFAKTKITSPANFFRQLTAASRYHFPDTKPKTDLLMLCSEGDHLVHPNCTKKIAKMWQVNPRVHPTGGHDLPIEDGLWICQEVHNWLGLGPQARPSTEVSI